MADTQHLQFYDNQIQRLKQYNRVMEEYQVNAKLYYDENMDFSNKLEEFLGRLTIFSIIFLLIVKFIEI